MIRDDIISSVLLYSDRDDAEIPPRIDLFFKVVEARVNKKLNTQPMNTRVILIGIEGQDIFDLPSNWLTIRDINIQDIALPNTTRKTLSLINPEQMNNAKGNNSPNYYYVIINNQLVINPAISVTQQIEISYSNRLVPIDVLNPENWLALNHPDCYIFGLLTEINAFVKDAEATAMWDKRFIEALSDLEFQDDVATYSGTPIFTKVG